MSEKTVVIIGIILVFFVGGVGIGIAVKEENPACAYCQNMIREHADTVICTDGRRYHAECYIQYIENKNKSE